MKKIMLLTLIGALSIIFSNLGISPAHASTVSLQGTSNVQGVIILEKIDPTNPPVINVRKPIISGKNKDVRKVKVESDPMIFDVIPDSDGNWSVSIPKDLEDGDHRITTYNAKDEVIQIYSFKVDLQAKEVTPKKYNYLILAIGSTIAVLGIGFIVFYTHKREY